MTRLHLPFCSMVPLLLTLAGCGGAATSSSAGTSTGTTSSLVATSTSLAVSPNPAAAGVPVTLTASVTATGTTPTGIVTFLDGATQLGSVALSSGSATLQLRTFAAGSTHALSASYPGTATLATSSSAAVSLTLPAAAAPSTLNAHATFSLATPHQTNAGFGGSEAFYLSYLDSHPAATDIYNALFDPAAGLGLTFLRLQNSYYLYNGSNATTFDTDTPKIVSAANSAHGSPLTLLLSSWTPPASLKSNASINGCTTTTNGSCTGGIGTLNQINGAYNYAGFAQFWADSLTAYAALGVTPAYISIQNEPDFAPTYVGCRFNPTETPITYFGQTYAYASYGLAFDAVYQKLHSGAAAAPKMIGPETFSTANAPSFSTQVPPAEVSAYAHHMYNVSSGGLPSSGGYSTGGNPDAALAADTTLASTFPTAMKFQTEYYQTPAFYTAWDIHNALTVANDNAYLYWALAWPSTVSNGISVDQAGLLYLDNPFSPSTWISPTGWAYNDSYYALKHFSFFVRPGYVRYDAAVDNPDERVSVYQSADKSTSVIVALNTSTAATDGLALDLSAFGYTSSTVYRSSLGSPQATGERLANLGAVASTGIQLPPQSIVTVVLTR